MHHIIHPPSFNLPVLNRSSLNCNIEIFIPLIYVLRLWLQDQNTQSLISTFFVVNFSITSLLLWVWVWRDVFGALGMEYVCDWWHLGGSRRQWWLDKYLWWWGQRWGQGHLSILIIIHNTLYIIIEILSPVWIFKVYNI